MGAMGLVFGITAVVHMCARDHYNGFSYEFGKVTARLLFIRAERVCSKWWPLVE